MVDRIDKSGEDKFRKRYKELISNRDELVELRVEVEQHKSAYDNDIQIVSKQLEAMNIRVGQLRTALEKYRRHLGTCKKFQKISRVHHMGDESRLLECTCGLEQALKGGE